MNYNYNTEYTAKQVFPPHLRNQSFSAHLKCLLHPLQVLRDYIFLTYKPDVEKRARITAQTKIQFEAGINYLMKITAEPKIKLTTGEPKEPVFLYHDNEDYQDVYLSHAPEAEPVYFVSGNEVTGGDTDFVVEIPTAYTLKEAQIKAIVNSYKVAGTRYKTIFY